MERTVETEIEGETSHPTGHVGRMRRSPERVESTGVCTHIFTWFLLGLSSILFLFLFPFCIRIVKEYERGVLFRLGRLRGAKGPGLFVILPIVDSITVVDLRTLTLDIPSQETITKDSVTVTVNAVVYFHVSDPTKAVVNVANFRVATNLLAQTTLRSVLGQIELDELLGHRERMNEKLQKILDEETEEWGIKVSAVEVKDVVLPTNLQRAMASQAEAERERRAKVISADGEFQASSRLKEAAQIMSASPAALQLRYLQTLTEIAAERNSTIVFPLPIEVLSLLGKRMEIGAPSSST